MRSWIGLLALLLVAPAAQSASLDLPVRGSGLSFGNSTNFAGVRFNLVDENVENLRGISVTFWHPRESPRGRLGGIGVGLVGQRLDSIRGLCVSGAGMTARRVQGIAIAGLGMGIGEDNSPSLGASSEAVGLVIAGLGLGAGNLRGIVVAGLGIGAGSMSGIAFGGLGMGIEEMRGIAIGGIGIGGERVSGLALGGIGMGANHFTGIGIGGIGVGGEDLSGLLVGGLGVGGDSITGLAVGGLEVRAGDLRGFAASAYTRVRGQQSGVTLGLLNIAHRLHGVQIGVVNYAGNASVKVLPLLNLHFER